MTTPRRRPCPASCRRSGAAGLLLWLAFGLAPAGAAVPTQTPLTLPKQVLAQLSGPAAAPTPPKTAAQGRPEWAALTLQQQQSLAPLAGTWNSLSAAQKRKWLALSQNFPRLSPSEQQVLHSRMRDWTELSTRQRAQARLNFGEAKQLSAADKKAMWEAYQALAPEEKKKLAAGAQAKPTTAAAVRPVARQKLASLPSAAPDARSPRIAAGPASDATSSDSAPGRAAGQNSQQAH